MTNRSITQDTTQKESRADNERRMYVTMFISPSL